MKTTLLALLVVLLAAGVVAQTTPAADEPIPAIMTPPAANLKKPIIFTPSTTASSPGADEPVFGDLPANFKKSAVSENIYGGAVEYERSRAPNGCPCRRQVPEKYRYDAQFRKERKAVTPCGCAPVEPKPEDKLPPVIAQLRREPKVINVTLPCNTTQPAPVVQKITPAYYPRRRKQALLTPQPCPKAPEPPKPERVTPEFYPWRSRRQKKADAELAAKDTSKYLTE